MQPMEKWNDRIQQRFIEILSDSRRPQGTFQFPFLDGFTRALTCSPQMVTLVNFISDIFNQQSSQLNDEETRIFYGGLFSLYNFHIDQVYNNQCEISISHQFSEDPTQRNQIEQWCQGFLLGYHSMEDVWNELAFKYPDAEVEADFQLEPLPEQLESILSVVNSIAYFQDALDKGEDVDFLKEAFDFLPETIILCGQIGLALGREFDMENIDEDELAEMEAEELEFLNDLDEDIHHVPFERMAEKIGRNDACPCGSGKKYKKCCLH